MAGLLREAWWSAASAGREVRVGRERLATSRDIARDVQRRADLGDIPPTDALLARNETLAAEFAVAQADAALTAARAAYRILTGGADPDLPPEPLAARVRVVRVVHAHVARRLAPRARLLEVLAVPALEDVDLRVVDLGVDMVVQRAVLGTKMLSTAEKAVSGHVI